MMANYLINSADKTKLSCIVFAQRFHVIVWKRKEKRLTLLVFIRTLVIFPLIGRRECFDLVARRSIK